MKKRLLLLVTFIALSVHAQETLTRSNGKKIVLNENGTWSYKPLLKSEEHDCAKYVKTSVNSVSGATNTAANDMLIFTKDSGKTGLSAILMNSKDQSTTIVSFKTLQPSCVIEKSLVLVVFDDGSNLKMTSNSRENCEGNVVLYFGGSFKGLDNLQKLAEKKIIAILISSTKGILTQELSDSEAETFKNTLKCLSNALTK